MRHHRYGTVCVGWEVDTGHVARKGKQVADEAGVLVRVTVAANTPAVNQGYSLSYLKPTYCSCLHKVEVTM